MKSFVLSVFLSLPLFALSLHADISWDKARLEKASIYLPVSPEGGSKRKRNEEYPYLQKAAEDLKEYLHKMTGADVPIVEVANAASLPTGQPAFVLGPLAVELGAHPPTTSFREDGYTIEVKEGRVLLAGEAAPGTAYAVADLLDRQGVRWYMPGPYGEEVPKRSTIVLPEAGVTSHPAYEDRMLWYNGGAQNQAGPAKGDWFNDWRRRNRLTLGRRLPTQHMWSSVFRDAGPEKTAKANREALFKSNPEEYFGIVDGTPRIRQLNLTSDKVVDLFVNYYLKVLKNEPKDVIKVLSASPDDGLVVNENPGSKPFVTQKDLTFSNLPDSTDLVIQFLNRIVTRVNAEYPNVKLAFYIYSNYQNGPTNVKMNENLVPFIAPLNFSRYHALNDATKPSRTLLANLVEKWSASGTTFGWRDYSFLCPDSMMPFTRLHMTPEELPWLYERGCRYYNTETTINWPNLLPEYYLITRILWDVKMDQNAALKEFYERFFGKAGESMRAYVEELANAYKNLPFSSGNKEFVDVVFNPERSRKLRSLIDQAKAAVAGDEIRAHRVQIVETALRQGERFMAMRKATNAFDYVKAQSLNQAILDAFDADYAFDPHTNTNFVKDVWYQRFYGKPVAQVAEWLQGAEVLHVFPDEWPAHLDLTSTGELEGLNHPASTAFEFLKLKTYSRSLAEQGWEKFRGDLWYRQTFPKIKVPEGKKPYLLFGGVVNQLKAWIDGKPIGEEKTRDFGPLLIPVELDEKGDIKTLTLKISNRSITELGVGGIIRPVALIAK